MAQLYRNLAVAGMVTLLAVAGRVGAGGQEAPTPNGPEAPAVERIEDGNRVLEGVPEIPSDLKERLERYQNTRGAQLAGWTRDGCLLISTRFAETAQAHRVCQPLGMREQLTFYGDRIGIGDVAPAAAARDGFLLARDRGGDEFFQIHWFDLESRETRLLSDGGRTRNGGGRFSPDGRWMAYSSNARNGSDTDVWLLDLESGERRNLVAETGTWGAVDFSPDGSRLLVLRYVSANESYPGIVDVASGELRMLPVEGGTAAFGTLRFTPDGRGLYYVSDETIGGQEQEFQTLRFHRPGLAEPEILSAGIPWDVVDFELSADGRRLAYVTNEDGIDRLHLLALPEHRPLPLPELPAGVAGRLAFSPDGARLAVGLNTATSPSDVFVLELAEGRAVRWTASEVGGLDSARFVAPELIRYETFDQIDGEPRTIPAFYYRPAEPPADGGRLPVILDIHGGPEAQARPTFNPMRQFLVAELGVAVLVPNVRGSAGYGKSYLLLDNGLRREDSVRDIGALLDWIAQQPELDAGRVGVMGGSYGGYMTLASLMHYSDRLRAGIDIVGISHFRTFLENTEDYRRDLRRAEYGDERDPEMAAHFDAISPLSNAHRIATPLFVAQGRNDPRVPYTEAEQIVAAVRGGGQPVWFLMFADEGHGFARKSNSDFFGAASVLFWQTHLLGEAPPAPVESGEDRP